MIVIRTGVLLDPLTRKMISIVDHYPKRDQIYVFSALRPRETDSFHSGKLYYGGHRAVAVDYGFGGLAYPERGRDFAEWLYQFWDLTLELIHTTPFDTDEGFYVKRQRRYPGGAIYGDEVPRHRDHVHQALTEPLADAILARLRAAAVPMPVTPAGDRPVLRRGDSGPWVGYLQARLRQQGYAIDVVAGDPFGPATEAAVRDMQARHGTLGGADGVVGKETWADVDYWALRATVPAGRPVLRQGDSGEWTGMAQQVLRRAGTVIDDLPGFPFGPATETAVKEFQTRYRTPGGVDGVVGTETWVDLDARRDGTLVPHPPVTEPPTPTPIPAPPQPEPDLCLNSVVAPLFGWDASDFDHTRGMRPEHIRAAAAEGIKFFTHKATELATSRSLVTHEWMGDKLTAARDAGIPFLGAYLVVRTGHDAATQAVACLTYVDGRIPWWKDHPGWFWQIDVERWAYDDVPPELGEEVAAALEEISGRRAILYASHGQYGDRIPGTRPLWNADYRGSGTPRLWLAQWLDVAQSLKEHADEPWTAGTGNQGLHPYSGRVPRLLQFASDATIGGQPTCDINLFTGTEQAFAEMIHLPDTGT